MGWGNFLKREGKRGVAEEGKKKKEKEEEKKRRRKKGDKGRDWQPSKTKDTSASPPSYIK